MSQVKLADYNNFGFGKDKPLLVRIFWFLASVLIVRSPLIPSSALRVFVLQLFGASIAQGVVIKPGVRVKFPWRLKIGRDSWIGEDVWIDNLAQVNIGENVCLSQGAYLCTGNHDWADPAFGLVVTPINIGDGAWVGAKSMICPGVNLGSHAIAVGGSVIRKSILDFEIHGGNPAVFLKRRELRAAAQTAPVASRLDALASEI